MLASRTAAIKTTRASGAAIIDRARNSGDSIREIALEKDPVYSTPPTTAKKTLNFYRSFRANPIYGSRETTNSVRNTAVCTRGSST